MSRLIYEDKKRSLLIKVDETPCSAMVDLIARTIWGSGGTRYQLLDAHRKLHLLDGSDFISLEERGQLIGAYVLRGKRVQIGDSAVPADYRTFLAIDRARAGRGYGRLLVRKVRNRYCGPDAGNALPYGYIEADNERSLRISRDAGYESIGRFGTRVFNRLFPRDDARVRALRPAEREQLVALLDAQYAQHALRDFEQSVAVAGYHVLAEDGVIRAGVQIEPCHWRVLALPGTSGRLLVDVVSRVPGLRRLFDAQNCRFLKLGNLYALPGDESALFPLIEALLARSGMNLAMVFQDPRSPVARRISQSGHFGILDAGVEAQVHVMAALEGRTDDQRTCLGRSPLHLSPLDIG